MSIHLVLLTMACCALAAAAAGGPLRGISDDVRRARQVSILIATALVTGNAACLLPGTPLWYSIALTALTLAGMVWMIVSQLAAVRADAATRALAVRGSAPTAPLAARPASLRLVSSSAVRDAGESEPPRPHLAVLPGGRPATAPTPSVVEATPVAAWDEDVRWDATPLTLVTRRELDAIGSRGARAQSVATARGIRTLAPESGRRRAVGSAFAARRHSPDGRLLRAQLRAAYDGSDVPPPILGTHA